MNSRQSRVEAKPVDLSVVIVNWNANEAIRDCLISLQTFPPSRDWEAIVVDNASTDGSVEWLSRAAPWVRLVVNDKNRGLAAANNQGLVAAKGDTMLVCNPDVVFTEGSIDALADVLDRRPQAAAAIARLVQADGSPQVSVGDLPGVREALLGRFSTGSSQFWWHDWAHDAEVAVGHGQEACYLVRRAAIAAAGPQDERFLLDWEGIDWSARMRDAGWEIWFCPSATVAHQGGVSVRKARMRWVVGTHRGMYRYFAKRTPALTRPALLAACAARGAAKAVRMMADAGDYERAHARARL